MPMMDPMFVGRGGRGMWRGGPWGPMGRGGFNNAEDGGIGIYVEDDSDGSKKRRSYSYRCVKIAIAVTGGIEKTSLFL